MDAIDPEMRDEMLRYMSKELKAVREQLEEERRKTRASGTPGGAVMPGDADFAELREENEAQQKRLEVLEEENARLWHHVARFESGEEDKPIALDISRSNDRHARLFELYYMPKDEHEAHCSKLLDRLKSAKEKRETARDEARAAEARAGAFDEKAKLAEQRAEEAENNAESNRQKYKDAKSELKEARGLIDDIQRSLEAKEQSISDLTKEVNAAKLMSSKLGNRFADMAEQNIVRLKKALQGLKGGTAMLSEETHLKHLPICDFPVRPTKFGFKLPNELQRPLKGDGYWAIKSTQAHGFAEPGLSRVVFLAPSHENVVRDDGSFTWQASPRVAVEFEGKRRHIFYNTKRGWRYLGLYLSTSVLEVNCHDIKSIPHIHTDGLSDKCISSRDLVPPVVVKQAHQLFNTGAIRVACFVFEKVQGDSGMAAALNQWALRSEDPSASAPGPSASTSTGAAQPNAKRTFSGPPTPIPKPGQPSSAPPSAPKTQNKRPRKDSPSAAPNSKNKKQKTKNGS